MATPIIPINAANTIIRVAAICTLKWLNPINVLNSMLTGIKNYNKVISRRIGRIVAGQNSKNV